LELGTGFLKFLKFTNFPMEEPQSTVAGLSILTEAAKGFPVSESEQDQISLPTSNQWELSEAGGFASAGGHSRRIGKSPATHSSGSSGSSGSGGNSGSELQPSALRGGDAEVATAQQDSGAGAAAAGELVIVMGGCGTNFERHCSAEYFNPLSNEWNPLPDMTTRRAFCAAVSCNGKVYVMGGHDGTRPLRSAEVYDPEENKWSAIAPMHLPR
jgi:hypothetical protein